MSKFKHLLFTLFFALSIPAQAEVLWDNWYVISEHGIPSSYYNEKAEIAGDKAKIQVNTWIKDGKRIKSENLGASAKNTNLLEPLLFNFRAQGLAGEEKIIDGTVLNNGKVFSVKAKEGIAPSKSLRAEMMPKIILTSFFPLWINKNYKRITGVQPIEFTAILEDKIKDEIPVVVGTAYEMREDEFAKKTKTRKLRIEFGKVVAFWWVTKKGDALQIEVPSAGQTVKKVDRTAAEHSLTP